MEHGSALEPKERAGRVGQRHGCEGSCSSSCAASERRYGLREADHPCAPRPFAAVAALQPHCPCRRRRICRAG